MGANHSLAQNLAEQSTQVQSTVLQTYINSCGTTISSNTEFVSNNCANFNVNNVNVETTAIFDNNCVQKISSNAQMDNDLKQAATQTAAAISKGLGFNDSDANNLSIQSIQLSQSVQQNFTNTCAGELRTSAVFDCTDSGNFIVDNVTIGTNVNSAVNCDQTATANVALKNQIAQSIEQAAKAVSAGPELDFDAILIFFAILMVAACFMIYYGEQLMIYLIIIVVVVAIIAIIGYLIYAKAEGKIPFKKK